MCIMTADSTIPRLSSSNYRGTIIDAGGKLYQHQQERMQSDTESNAFFSAENATRGLTWLFCKMSAKEQFSPDFGCQQLQANYACADTLLWVHLCLGVRVCTTSMRIEQWRIQEFEQGGSSHCRARSARKFYIICIFITFPRALSIQSSIFRLYAHWKKY